MYYAEFETDKYIREKFFLDENQNMTMVEVGAGPIEFYSMSKHFRDSGWRAIGIDPNPKFVEQHRMAGNEIYQYACSNECKSGIFNIVDVKVWGHEREGISSSAIDIRYDLEPHHTVEQINVEIITLNSLLEKLNIKKINLISIDVEGWELEVMEGLDINTYNIKVIMLENFLHNEIYNQYMKNNGYSLYNKIEYNYIYTKDNS
jgi:FkbM family methyltransferase